MGRTSQIFWIDDRFIKKEHAALDCSALSRYLIARGLEKFEIEPYAHPMDAWRAISTQREVDVIIFDWDFGLGGKPQEEALNLLHESAPEIPVFVYSGKATAEDVRHVPGVREFIDRSDLAGLAGAVARELLSPLPRLLVLSDLHFGAGHVASKQSESLFATLQPELEGYLRKAKINCLAILGDLSSQASRHEFAAAREFLSATIAAVGIGREEVFIIPGNHDVQLSEEYSYDNYATELLKRFYRSTPGVLGSFVRQGLEEDNFSQSDLAWVRVSPTTGTTFIGLNSAMVTANRQHRIARYGRGVLGNVSTEQLTRLGRLIDQVSSPGSLRIALVHHQLFPVPSRAGANAKSLGEDRVLRGQALLMNWLSENGISLLLHGHSHYPSARTIKTHYCGNFFSGSSASHIVACGTTGARELAESITANHYCVACYYYGEDTIELKVESRILSRDGVAWTDGGIMNFRGTIE